MDCVVFNPASGVHERMPAEEVLDYFNGMLAEISRSAGSLLDEPDLFKLYWVMRAPQGEQLVELDLKALPAIDFEFYKGLSRVVEKETATNAMDLKSYHLPQYSCSYEDQYVNGVKAKTNFYFGTPEYARLFVRTHELGFPRDVVPHTLSIKEGKITAYTSNHTFFRTALGMMNVRDPYESFFMYAMSVEKDGRPSLKIYRPYSELPVDEFQLLSSVFAGLPKGSMLKEAYGVAYSYRQDGERDPIREVFFTAPVEDMREWVKGKGMTCPEITPDYWGIGYDNQGNIRPLLKALVVTEPAHGPVEYCWQSGQMHRIGYSVKSKEGAEMYARIPEMLHMEGRDNRVAKKLQSVTKDNVSNISVTEYDLGEHGKHEILSMYIASDLPESFRKIYRIPDHINVPPWYGVKYSATTGHSWLKVIDTEYKKYPVPELPENATTASVALVFPETDTQPPAHYDKQANTLDVTFFTHDIAAVREWCSMLGIADPNPNLPDVLDLYGVYSLTFNADTGKVVRLKFYAYDSEQLFEMETYLRGIVEGNKQGYRNGALCLNDAIVANAYASVLNVMAAKHSWANAPRTLLGASHD